MVEMALRGLWRQLIEEAKVLAQSGGDDDEARMIITSGHITCRRLDAARESLYNLQQPEGYDEPELLAFICEWFDPYNGAVDEDDLWDWENNPCIDHLKSIEDVTLMGPQPTDSIMHKDNISITARLTHVALLRAQNMHKEALDISLRLVRENPTMALQVTTHCVLLTRRKHSALSVLTELKESVS